MHGDSLLFQFLVNTEILTPASFLFGCAQCFSTTIIHPTVLSLFLTYFRHNRLRLRSLQTTANSDSRCMRCDACHTRAALVCQYYVVSDPRQHLSRQRCFLSTIYLSSPPISFYRSLPIVQFCAYSCSVSSSADTVSVITLCSATFNTHT